MACVLVAVMLALFYFRATDQEYKERKLSEGYDAPPPYWKTYQSLLGVVSCFMWPMFLWLTGVTGGPMHCFTGCGFCGQYDGFLDTGRIGSDFGGPLTGEAGFIGAINDGGTPDPNTPGVPCVVM